MNEQLRVMSEAFGVEVVPWKLLEHSWEPGRDRLIWSKVTKDGLYEATVVQESGYLPKMEEGIEQVYEDEKIFGQPWVIEWRISFYPTYGSQV